MSPTLADLLKARTALPELSDDRLAEARRDFVAQIRKAPPQEDVPDRDTT